MLRCSSLRFACNRPQKVDLITFYSTRFKAPYFVHLFNSIYENERKLRNTKMRDSEGIIESRFYLSCVDQRSRLHLLVPGRPFVIHVKQFSLGS
jgi:hypothetical protein